MLSPPGGIGRRTGLKILRIVKSVPVQVRGRAPFIIKMLAYIRNFILSKNFYLILFSFWAIKQIFYSFNTLSIYKNVSLIFIIIFFIILLLIFLSIFKIINKKKFFQYFSIIFLSLIFGNFIYDITSDKIKQKRNEVFIKKLLKEKNKYDSFDFRTQKQVVEDLKKENKSVYPAILPSFYFKESKFFSELLPLSGISHVTTVLCNESGKYSVYQSDRYGFNNPDVNYDNYTEKRVMLIGDSFVHGACVDQKDTLSFQLNKINIPSFSISYGGNGPLLELATLIEYIVVLKPESIIWFYTENDLPNLEIEKKSKFLMQYLKKKDFTQNLVYRQNEIDNLWKKVLKKNLDIVDFNEVIKKKTFFQNFFRKLERSLVLKPMRDSLKLYYEKELILYYERSNKENLVLYTEIISKVKEVSNKNNSSLYFVYLPFLLNVVEHSSTKKEIINIVEKLDIKVIDFHEYLIKEIDPKSFFPLGKHGHYNDTGYKALSNLISKYLN